PLHYSVHLVTPSNKGSIYTTAFSPCSLPTTPSRTTKPMLKVKKLHPDAQLPTVAHAGTHLGFDLYALEDTALPPGVPVKVRTGIAVESPDGYGFVVGDRSSMASKGITYMGGRIDAGYRGELL